MNIRRAQADDAAELTRVTLDSKALWQYPSAWMDMWRAELTISPRYVEENPVYVCEIGNHIVGYYSFHHEKDAGLRIGDISIHSSWWLDNLFILSFYTRQGIGTCLYIHAAEHSAKLYAITRFYIISDPNAFGFYLKMGAIHIGDKPSRIPGRSLCVLMYEVN